jgi:hypothetical protein
MWNTVKFAKMRSEACFPKFTFARALRHAVKLIQRQNSLEAHYY